jgi:hypothetical protein
MARLTPVHHRRAIGRAYTLVGGRVLLQPPAGAHPAGVGSQGAHHHEGQLSYPAVQPLNPES